jgi:hypothetical protein
MAFPCHSNFFASKNVKLKNCLNAIEVNDSLARDLRFTDGSVRGSWLGAAQ